MMPWAKLKMPEALKISTKSERDQRIENAGNEAFPDHLHQQVGCTAHFHERLDEYCVLRISIVYRP